MTAKPETLTRDRSTWTIRHLAARRLAADHNRTFITEAEGPTETYGEFIGRSAALANFLTGIGVGHGTAVATLCSNGLPALHAWLAAGLIGAVDVTLNPAYRGDVLRHALDMTKPPVVIAEAELVHALEAIRGDLPFVRDIILVGDGDVGRTWPVACHAYASLTAEPAPGLPQATVRPADIGAIMFTSGTTSRAKGVMLPNAQLCLVALQAIEAVQMTADDVFYCVHPMNHVAGKVMGMFATFATGGRVILDKRFSAPLWLERVRRHNVTLTMAHGPMIEMIHAQMPTPHDRDHAVRRMMCCPLPKRIGAEFEARFRLRGVEMWGMTEIGNPFWTSLNGPRVPGSCGRLLDEWYDCMIVDPDTDERVPPGAIGEIVVRPRHPWTVMQGYIGMADETIEAWRNLWFHTGDAAFMDADGNCFFIDRMKDRIRRRAENISSFDIEAAANEFPPVLESAAIGIPSGYEGDDDIKLCVVPRPGAQVAPSDLLKFLASRLPHFMVPRYIEIMDKLPRTPTNKIRKRELREAGNTEATWDRQHAGVGLRDLYRTEEAGKRPRT